MPRTFRVQIDLTESRYYELEKLIELGGFETKKDFFDNAITLIKWAMKQSAQRRSVGAVDDEAQKYTELQMPFLDRVRERAERESNARNYSAAG